MTESIVIRNEAITQAEISRLGELETIVETGLTVFVAVGNALLEIRDSRLYRQQYPTFEAYCRERWGLKQSHAYRMIDAAAVVGNLQSSPIGELPKTESQARPLTRLEPEVQREVWREVVDSTPVETITARTVEERAKAAEPLNEAVRAIKEELKAEPPAQQSIIPEPAKPKDLIVAAATEKVKAGEMTVLEAAKEIKAAHNHRAQGTGENEWYTPAEYIEAAREVLDVINLDPATSETANRTVRAEQIFTRDDDSLSREWSGNIWMNPPYSQPHIQQFVEKLVEEYRSGRAKQAIALTHNYTDTAWFHHAATHCDAICFTRGRIAFVGPGGEKAAPTQGQAFFYFGEKTNTFKEKFSKIGFVVTRAQ